MSKNNLFFGHGEQWKRPVALHASHGGKWSRARAKLVGVGGRWVEVFDGEASSPTAPVEVEALSFRAGTPGQADLKLDGRGLSDSGLPNPTDYYFYPLRTGLGELMENAGNLIGYGDNGEGPAPSGEADGGLLFDAARHQYLRQPTDAEGGVDLLGVLGLGGAAGQKMWLLGLQFCPAALPVGASRVFLFYAGVPGQRLFLSYNGAGDLTFTWEGSSRLELTLPGACQAGRWSGVWIKHEPGAPATITMRSDRGAQVIQQGGIPYFTPSMVEADAAFLIGRGVADGVTVVDAEYFKTGNTHAGLTIVGPDELYNATATFRSAQPGDVMPPNTGAYYIEIANHTTYDMHFGVAEVGANLASAPGVVGWATNTISGRKFNHQTGGGTNWSTAVLANSTIGLLYDSDNGQTEVFVGNVSRGRPFPVGTITVPVKFIIGGIGGVDTPFRARVAVSRSQWLYGQPVERKEFPRSSTTTPGATVYLAGAVRSWFLRNAPYVSDSVQNALISPVASQVKWRNRATRVEYSASDYSLKATDSQIIATVPDIPPGDYEVYVSAGEQQSTPKAFTVRPFQSRAKTLHLDFASASRAEVRGALVRAHKAWGGANGGVVADNVIHDAAAGLLRVRACGDSYPGPIRGVDRQGQPLARTTRIGGCIVTRDYYGPGSYRVLAKLPSEDGVVSAFWTFHYEEGYPGHPLFDRHVADGLRQAGNPEAGYYTVRNHEIDIEIPTALKGAPDMEVVSYRNARFNAWRGENRNWDVGEADPDYWTEYTDDFIDHGVQTNDGNFHEFRFDWHLGETPRVEFYIDGDLQHTLTTSVPDIPGRFWVGLWFPSAVGNHWAGKTADFAEQWMEIKSLSIQPFTEESGMRAVGESYPIDNFRDMYDDGPS